MWDLDRMAGRTNAIVNPTLIRNVRIVLLVQIAAVPAALEVDLRAHAVLALGAVHVRLLDDDVVDAVEADAVGDGAAGVVFGAVGHCRVVVAAGGLVAGEDHEAFGEGHCLGDVWAAAEVVHYGAVVADFDEGVVRVAVVEGGRPVGGLVGADFAGCAAGVDEGVVGCVYSDIYAVLIAATSSREYTGTYLSHRLSNGYAPPKLLD
jgi:hypothetical protein